MPYSRDPSNFPPEFAAIFKRAIKEDFEIDAKDRGAAINFCHKLHAYRRAIETQKAFGYTALRNTTIRVLGTRVTFNSNESLMKSIREAVGESEPSETDLDIYLEQLEKGETNEHGITVPESLSGEQETRGWTINGEEEEEDNPGPSEEGSNSED